MGLSNTSKNHLEPRSMACINPKHIAITTAKKAEMLGLQLISFNMRHIIINIKAAVLLFTRGGVRIRTFRLLVYKFHGQ